MLWLYVLGVIGAVLGGIGDVCATQAARGGVRLSWLDAMGLLAYASCYPIWRSMSSQSGGSFAKVATAWTVTGAVVSVACALLYSGSDQESSVKRGLFIAIILCALARGIVK